MSPSSPLQSLLNRRLPRLWEEAPELATLLGAPGRDHVLPEANREAMERRLDFYRAWNHELEACHPTNAEEALDITVLKARIESFRFAYEDLATWQHNPDPFTDLGELLFLSASRQQADVEGQFANIEARLRALPSYVKCFRDRIEKADRLWLAIADQVAASIGSLFDALPHQAATAGVSEEGLLRLTSAAEEAKQAAKEHRRWLASRSESDLVDDAWRLGEDAFAALLNRKHLGMSPTEISRLGQEQLILRKQQRASHQRPEPTAPKSFADVLETVRSVVRESRTFCLEQGLIDLVPGEELSVEATPAFLRPLIPFAALMHPGPLETEQRSMYLVTEPPEGELNSLNTDRVRGIAVHEGYPGHHAQLSTANRRCSLARARITCALPVEGAAALGVDLVEGWAHYCEELMLDLGFHSSEGLRWHLRNDQVLRALRMVVDSSLNSGRMGLDEAQDLLVAEAGLSPAAAKSEVHRYTRTPAYPLCYLIGKLKLEALAQDLQTEWQEGFSLGRFHRAVQAAGSIPIDLLRPYLLSNERTHSPPDKTGLHGQAGH